VRAGEGRFFVRAWTKHKWQVALLRPGEPDKNFPMFCSGALISPGWVLTAAHCVDSNTPYPELLLGTASLISGKKREKVTGIFIYKLYVAEKNHGCALGDYQPPQNDIALLHFGGDGDAETINPILPNEENTFITSGGLVNIAGWGFTEEGATQRIICWKSTCQSLITQAATFIIVMMVK